MARENIMLYLIKFLVNSLIYILRYIMIGTVLTGYLIVCTGIVIPITILISTLKWMWKFDITAFDGGFSFIIILCDEFSDLYTLNKPSFKTWK